MRDIIAAASRILDKTEMSETGCHICTYSTGSHGYAQAWDGETVVLAHRIIWEFFNGPILNDMTVDHICHVRTCVNPKHLRLLSNSANASDNSQTKIYVADQPPCRNGHARIKTASGQIYCRICKAAKKRENRLARRL